MKRSLFLLSALIGTSALALAQKPTINVISTTQPSASNGIFTAPLTAGGNIDNGLFVSTVGTLKTVTYQ